MIACMGLSYKPDIDDLRGNDPALEIFHDLEKERFRVMAVEPNLRKHRNLRSPIRSRLSERRISLSTSSRTRNSGILIPVAVRSSLDFCGIAVDGEVRFARIHCPEPDPVRTGFFV